MGRNPEHMNLKRKFVNDTRNITICIEKKNSGEKVLEDLGDKITCS